MQRRLRCSTGANCTGVGFRLPRLLLTERAWVAHDRLLRKHTPRHGTARSVSPYCIQPIRLNNPLRLCGTPSACLQATQF